MNGFESGTQFDFSYAAGTTDAQILGFEMAGEFWSQYLTDNVTINLHVEMTNNLPDNVIGGALPAIEDNIKYENYRRNLKRDRISGLDYSVERNQQDEDEKFTAYFSSKYEEDGYKVDNNEYLNMTRANAKALNLVYSHSGKLDGYILMRDLDGWNDGDLNNIRWDYNYNDNYVANNELDFLSVAIHEVGHAIGFVSGLDQANWLSGVRKVNSGNEDDFYSDLVGNLNNATPLDMLRFSRNSYQMSGDDENWIDMSVGGNPYLSFNGSGGRPVAYFSTGINTSLGGDGSQASHWKQQDNAMGIMDPVLRTGQKREITNLDKQLFDAIGWNVNYSSRSNWQEVYNDALENAEDAVVRNRTEDVNKMINSSVVYNGRRSRRSRSGGSWQTGLWQHILFQTVDVEVENFQAESNVAQVLINNYLSQLDSDVATQNESDDENSETTIVSEFDVEKVAVQLIENSELVDSESTSLNLEVLGQLLSKKSEDVLGADVESLAMPIG